MTYTASSFRGRASGVGAAAGLALLALTPLGGVALASNAPRSEQIIDARAPVNELERVAVYELRGGAKITRYEQEVGGITVAEMQDRDFL